MSLCPYLLRILSAMRLCSSSTQNHSRGVMPLQLSVVQENFHLKFILLRIARNQRCSCLYFSITMEVVVDSKTSFASKLARSGLIDQHPNKYKQNYVRKLMLK